MTSIRLLHRTLALAVGIVLAGALMLVSSPAAARGGAYVSAGWHGGPGHHRGHWGHRGAWPGAFWGGVGLGLGVGAIAYYGNYYGGYYGGYYGPWHGRYVYDAPLVVAPVYGPVVEADVPRTARPVPAAPAPEPIFYPRNGQSAEAAETDRRDCNRWATTQRGAMADASIFQRATLACMEGRGYTVR
jgi:hypothetical protein